MLKGGVMANEEGRTKTTRIALGLVTYAADFLIGARL